MSKSGVEYLAMHPGWRTTKPRVSKSKFFSLLSGKVEYAVQWEQWTRLCEENGADPEVVLGLLQRVHEAVRS
jgi:hypothetical protein